MIQSLMNTKDRRKGHLKYEHLEDAPIPITICDGERMTIQYANQCALSLFISANRDFLGKTISEIFPGRVSGRSYCTNMSGLFYQWTSHSHKEQEVY